MKLMVSFRFPTETGNGIVGSGKINDIFQKIMEDLKPEAAYFYPVDGDRGGVLFVNANDPSELDKHSRAVLVRAQRKGGNNAGDVRRRADEGYGGGSRYRQQIPLALSLLGSFKQADPREASRRAYYPGSTVSCLSQ